MIKRDVRTKKKKYSFFITHTPETSRFLIPVKESPGRTVMSFMLLLILTWGTPPLPMLPAHPLRDIKAMAALLT